ncbi:MAG: ferritin-like domain-containing protein [Dongiaceae bacterium]
MLLDSFDAYKPAVIAWPSLSGPALDRLVGLPFWEMAVQTEHRAGKRMAALAAVTEDPLIREAVALNAFEEERHRDVLGHMIRHYGIVVDESPPVDPPEDAFWAFLRTGYGECFDSFFAFGLFQLARRSGFFPEPLVEVFEPVIQEEARHNLFFVNWVAYVSARRGLPGRARLTGQRLAALAVQAWSRASIARNKADGDNFTLTGGESIGLSLQPREFLTLCLTEHDRRMSGYDPRLLRPRLMPGVARLASRLLRRPAGAPPTA